jgi:AraC family transcriptional regulator
MFEELEFTEAGVPPVLAAQVPGSCEGIPDLPPAIGKAFGTLIGFIQRHGLAPSGPPRVLYTSCPPAPLEFRVLIPVSAPPAGPSEDTSAIVETVAGGTAYRFTHRGPYHNLAQTYDRITEFLKSRGWMETDADWLMYMPMWEEYLNDPTTTPEADLLTHIYLPARSQ